MIFVLRPAFGYIQKQIRPVRARPAAARIWWRNAGTIGKPRDPLTTRNGRIAWLKLPHPGASRRLAADVPTHDDLCAATASIQENLPSGSRHDEQMD